MFGDGDERPAYRLPEHNGYTATTAEAEPEIVRAARAYEEAQRELQHLQEQREKIAMSIQEATSRKDEAAKCMTSIIQQADARPKRGFAN